MWKTASITSNAQKMAFHPSSVRQRSKHKAFRAGAQEWESLSPAFWQLRRFTREKQIVDFATRSPVSLTGIDLVIRRCHLAAKLQILLA